MARANFVKRANKDYPKHGIKKGDSYYWWKFKGGSKQYSKERPSRSQLTQPGFLSQLYAIEDRIGSFVAEDKDSFESFKEDILQEIENLKDETQESLDNMPEHLQETSTSGQLLAERIEALEGWHSEIENVEVEDYSEEDLRSDAIDELKESHIPESDNEDEDEYEPTEAEITNIMGHKIMDYVEAAVAELQETNHNL